MKTPLLKAALFTPMANGSWGLPIIIWGAPGVAKTATIKALGSRYGFHVEHLSPGERGEGAFGVTPVPEGVNGSTVLRYPPPEWVEQLKTKHNGRKEESGIVLVDEIGSCPPAIQPALLGIIQERRIGGHLFGSRVRILGAGNPTQQAAGGWDLAPPVANRCGHIDWPSPSSEEWGAWLMGSTAEQEPENPEVEEQRVMGLWPTAYAKASGIMSAFVRVRPELLHRMPADGDPAQSRAWPSPRSWEYATRAMASAQVHSLKDIHADELIAAFIGRGAAGELGAWLASADLPDPGDLLDGRVSFKPDPKRLDRTEAVLNACAALVLSAKADRRNERVGSLWLLICEYSKGAKDIAVPAVTALVRAGLQRHEAAAPALANLYAVINAAEVTS